MKEYFSRTQLLLGEEGMEKLYAAKVALFGLGGVGSFAAEALARSGIGHLVLVDGDVVNESNINRQLIATTKTIGQYKTEVMKQRIGTINPNAIVEEHRCFYQAETIDFTGFDYIIDAIDMVSSKLLLIEQAKKTNVLIISCMGAGNKLDATQFAVADIYETSVCPLAKVMRKELKNRGIKDVKVVYSREPAIKTVQKQSTIGSVSFVPSVAGLLLAGEVIKDIVKKKFK